MAKKKSLPPGYEYRLLVTPYFDEREQAHKTLIVLETTKMFASFRYDLSVDETIEGKTIAMTVRGLRAPRLSLPTSGSARFERLHEQLNGTYDISVKGLDGMVNTFKIKVTPKTVRVLAGAAEGFVQLFTDLKTWKTVK
jgi:hypothetical protein